MSLLNVCGGLDKPTSGEIYVEGVDIGKLASDELTEFRRKRIGFIFQNYNLISVMSVYENIVLPVQMGGNLEDRELFGRIMDALGLTGLEHRLPSELSGGQQQRVAIARALISTLMSITTLTRRNQQMIFGSQAEGIYTISTVHWSDLLRDSGYFDEVTYAVYMGVL